MFDWMYPQLTEKAKEIEQVFAGEEKKFFDVLKRGSGFVEKTISEIEKLSATDLALKAFDLFQSVGYPSEIFLEEIKDHGIKVDEAVFKKTYDETYDKHQEISRAGIDKKFKGGLADTSEINIRYHTATHLLQRALKNVLGEHVVQLGSNITSERLRFDFPHRQKLTEEEIKAVEKIMNDAVDAAMPVTYVMLPKEEAVAKGAVYMKNESYPETVKVYYIGPTIEDAFSKEFCGGPHVENTSTIGHLEILKQENIGDGKQRVYARFSSSS
jgi:alanyl-tRNA synthetase